MDSVVVVASNYGCVKYLGIIDLWYVSLVMDMLSVVVVACNYGCVKYLGIIDLWYVSLVMDMLSIFALLIW